MDYVFILKVCRNKWLSMELQSWTQKVFLEEHLSLCGNSRNFGIFRVRIESNRVIYLVKYLAKAPFFSIIVPLQLEEKCNQLSAAWNYQRQKSQGGRTTQAALVCKAIIECIRQLLAEFPIGWEKWAWQRHLVHPRRLDRTSHNNYRPEPPCIPKTKHAAIKSVVQSNKLFSVTTEYVCFGTEHNATSNSYMVVNLFQ